MKIVEITRPDYMNDAAMQLMRQGYEKLGAGCHGVVLAKPDEPFCLKLFGAEDTSYLAYLNLITRVPNPHFPQVKGKPTRISDNYYAVRLERLEPTEGFNADLSKHAKNYVFNYQELARLEDQQYKSTIGRSPNNITDEDRALIAQLGHIPDDWLTSKFTTMRHDDLPNKITNRRNKVITFEKHFPDLAEALRLIDKYVLYGESPDLQPANLMQRGNTIVITDPSSAGVPQGPIIPPTQPQQKQLFTPKRRESDISLYTKEIPDEVRATPLPARNQMAWQDL